MLFGVVEPRLPRDSKERLHKVPEVAAVHRLEHRAHDRAQHPQEARREPREESRRCECPFLGRHTNLFHARSPDG